jgi:hypothetical protein
MVSLVSPNLNNEISSLKSNNLKVVKTVKKNSAGLKTISKGNWVGLNLKKYHLTKKRSNWEQKRVISLNAAKYIRWFNKNDTVFIVKAIGK